jgi:hypothetical protein
VHAAACADWALKSMGLGLTILLTRLALTGRSIIQGLATKKSPGSGQYCRQCFF